MEFQTPKSKLVSIQVSDLVSTNFLCMFALNIPSRLQLRSCTLSALSAGKFNGLGVETQGGITRGGPMGSHEPPRIKLLGSVDYFPRPLIPWHGEEACGEEVVWPMTHHKWEDAVSGFSRVCYYREGQRRGMDVYTW